MIDARYRRVAPVSSLYRIFLDTSRKRAYKESMKHPLQRERERLNLSREGLARQAGVSHSSVQKWEGWERQPRHAQQVAIRAALNTMRGQVGLNPLSNKLNLFPHPNGLPKGARK